MNDASEIIKAAALPESESEIDPPQIAGASVIGSDSDSGRAAEIGRAHV